VIPEFQFEVFSVRSESRLIDLLTEMEEKDFSQAPIPDDARNVIEMISTNIISRWLFGVQESADRPDRSRDFRLDSLYRD